MAHAAVINSGRATIIDTQTRSTVRRVGPSKGIEIVASNEWLVMVVHDGGKATLYRLDTGQRIQPIATSGVINIDLSDKTAVLSFESGRWAAFDLRRMKRRIHADKQPSKLNAKLLRLLEQ